MPRLLLLLLTLPFLAGCGSPGPSLTPVKGTVLLGARPLDTGTVVFIPDPADPGRSEARSPIGSDGAFNLTTNGQPGAAIGRYKVTVFALRQTDSTAAPQWIIPERYSRPNGSDLAVEVTNDPARNHFRLELKDR